jgi:pimeloyl-ACP methyl ester carboxylesterase
MPFASVNGIDLYYESHGDGPAVVFAHGAGGNHLSWWQQIPVFAGRFRCITFDHRAFGLSRDGEGEGQRGRRAFHDDLRDLLDHLGVDDVRIVAQSMGGRTAVGFALRNPGRCKAMVLAGTTGGAVTDEVRHLQARYRETERGSQTLMRRAIAPDLKERDAEREFLYRSINRLNPARPKDFLAPIPGYTGSSATRLAEAGFPILFVVGRHDAITPPEIIERCHEAVPGSQYRVIEESGHSAYFEQPQGFNDAVMPFLLDSLEVADAAMASGDA